MNLDNLFCAENTAEPRGRILFVALNLFSQKPFKDVTIREIADEAKVNLAMISYYFGGKNNLYSAVVKELDFIARNKIKEIRLKGGTPVEKLIDISSYIFEALDKLPLIQLFEQEWHGKESFDPIYRQLISYFYDFIDEIFATGINQKFFRQDVDYSVLTLMYRSLLGFQLVRREKPDDIFVKYADYSRYLDGAFKIFLKGILIDKA